MDDTPQSLRELQDMQDYVRGRLVDKKAFSAFVQSLQNVWHKLRTAVDMRISAFEGDLKSVAETLNNKIDMSVSYYKNELSNALSGVKNDLTSTERKLDSEIQDIRAMILDIESMMPEEYDDTGLKEQLDNLKMSIPKIVTLQEVWDRFAVLEKKIKELSDAKPSIIRQVINGTRFGGGIGRNQVVGYIQEAIADGLISTGGVGTTYNEVLTNSGDDMTFTALHTINSVFSLVTGNGQYISKTRYTVSGSSIILNVADADIASVGLELSYA